MSVSFSYSIEFGLFNYIATFQDCVWKIPNDNIQIPNKSQNKMTKIPNLLSPNGKVVESGFLVIGIWLLFVIFFPILIISNNTVPL